MPNLLSWGVSRLSTRFLTKVRFTTAEGKEVAYSNRVIRVIKTNFKSLSYNKSKISWKNSRLKSFLLSFSLISIFDLVNNFQRHLLRTNLKDSFQTLRKLFNKYNNTNWWFLAQTLVMFLRKLIIRWKVKKQILYFRY